MAISSIREKFEKLRVRVKSLKMSEKKNYFSGMSGIRFVKKKREGLADGIKKAGTLRETERERSASNASS